MKILLVEDNNNLALNIIEYFESKGHLIDYSADGLIALNLAVSQRFDVIVLDIMLPGLNGIDICQRLRDSADIETPIIMLTAKDTEQDKLRGFGAGADDYLVKPFSLVELEARLLALIRRSKPYFPGHRHLVVGDLVYDPVTMKLKRGEVDLHLMRVPLKILILLMQNPARVVTREEIEEEIWNDELPDSEVLRSHIYAIRSEINKHNATNILHTIRGVGYLLSESDYP
jgi:DNA-binding response OmpR family regulator